MSQIPEANRFYQMLEKIRKDVEALKASSSSTQLSNSSIDVFEGRGFIPIIENGVEKHRIGRQPDGTITSVSKNNNDPPATPNDPVCTPFIGGVTVQCTGFTRKQYLDFSHIRVYVDGQLTDCILKVPGAVAVTPLDQGPHEFYLRSVNLSDTASPPSGIVVASPNQVVGDDIAQGIITDLQLADEAVTNAKLAAEAVTGTKIAAETIEGSKIAAQTILGEKLVAETITGDKIAANTITALKIAANAIEAANIKAGSVTGEKLSAEVILATAAIIVGNPTLARLVLDSTGLTQVDNKGNIAMQIGATPNQGNFLTVIDPTDSSNALATLGRDGSITINGLNVSGNFFLNGVDLIKFLNDRPQGLIAEGTFVGSYSSPTSSEIGIFELNFQTISGRSYNIYSDQFKILGSVAWVFLRYTTDGSVPTINSPILSKVLLNDTYYQIYTGITNGHNHLIPRDATTGGHNCTIDATSSNVIRILLTIAIPIATDEWGSTFPVFDYVPAPIRLRTINNKLTLSVADVGSTPTYTGGNNSGDGNTSATGQQIRTYTPTYTKYVSTAPGSVMQNGLQQGKAGNITYVSMIGWDQSAIALALNGATVQKVEIYLYANYWSIAEGGFCCIGTHNVANVPTTYSYLQRDVKQQFMKKPQGVWIQMPNNFATNLASGSVRGIVLDSTVSYPEANNYGIFRELTYTDATVRPSLRITYVK